MSRAFTRSCFVLVGALTALAATAASASPYGGDRLASARTEVPSVTGLQIYHPDVILAAQGARIHGAVCRTGLRQLSVPAALTIEHVDATGRVLEALTARPAGAVWGRGPGCAYYDLQTSWSVRPSDTVRVLQPARS